MNDKNLTKITGTLHEDRVHLYLSEYSLEREMF